MKAVFLVLVVALFVAAELALFLSGQTVKLTAPSTAYGRDFLEVREGGSGGKQRVEIHDASGLARQVRLYQPPVAGSQCNVGKFGTFGDYLYVCRPLDGTAVGLWTRTKLEIAW